MKCVCDIRQMDEILLRRISLILIKMHLFKKKKTREEKMGQMNVIPGSPTELEQKMEPLPGFVAITSADAAWATDSDAPRCNDCASAFGIMTRRHHCRACGQCFCDRCCPTRHLYHGHRACMKCTSNAIVTIREQLLQQYSKPKVQPKSRQPAGV